MNVKAITAPVAKAIKAPIEASAKKAEPYFFRGDAAIGQTEKPSSRVKFMDMELDCNKYFGAGSLIEKEKEPMIVPFGHFDFMY